MAKERGSGSILLLICCLFFALVLQLFIGRTVRDAGVELEVIRDYKLRLLSSSAMDSLWDSRPSAGQYQVASLQEGKEKFIVECTSRTSEDGLIYWLEVAALASNHAGAVQRLCRIALTFPEQYKTLGATHALVSKNPLQGAEYLAEEGLYTSEEVPFPQADFLQGKAVGHCSTETLQTDGVPRQIHYSAGSTSINIPGGELHGSGAFVNYGNISVAQGCHLYDRVILFSDGGNIYLGRNSALDKALVICQGRVTVEEGCSLRGLVIANEILLKGAAGFTADPDVVAPFESACFLSVK